MLGLEGVEVDLVEREADGSWTVHVRTAAGQDTCCPDCGRASGRVKEPTVHTLQHVALVAMRLTWHKSRFWCENTDCDKASFAQTGPVAGVRAGVSAHAKTVMGHLIGDWLAPVSRVAAGVGVAWHTAHDAFVGVAAGARIVVTDTKTDTATSVEPGCPHRETTEDDNTAAAGDPTGVDVDRAPASAQAAARPSRAASSGRRRRATP